MPTCGVNAHTHASLRTRTHAHIHARTHSEDAQWARAVAAGHAGAGCGDLGRHAAQRPGRPGAAHLVALPRLRGQGNAPDRSQHESQGSARDSAMAAMRLPAATAATSLYCWALLLAEVLPASASAGSAAVWLPQQDSWRPYSPWSACLRPAHEHCETERGRGCGGQVASSKGSEVLEDHGVNVGGFIFG